MPPGRVSKTGSNDEAFVRHNLYQPPTMGSAVVKLVAGLFSSGMLLVFTALVHRDLTAWERSQSEVLRLPEPVFVLYDLVGSAWTVGLFGAITIAVFIGGVVGFWRTRRAVLQSRRPR